jgi:hypothetical protein
LIASSHSKATETSTEFVGSVMAAAVSGGNCSGLRNDHSTTWLSSSNLTAGDPHPEIGPPSHGIDQFVIRFVEIRSHPDPSPQGTQSARRRTALEGHQPRHWPAVTSDDDLLTSLHLFEQLGKLSLGLIDIHLLFH